MIRQNAGPFSSFQNQTNRISVDISRVNEGKKLLEEIMFRRPPVRIFSLGCVLYSIAVFYNKVNFLITSSRRKKKKAVQTVRIKDFS